MNFKNWLDLQEVGTGTNSVAVVFARPIMGMVQRKFPDEESKKKKVNEGFSVTPDYYKGKNKAAYEAAYDMFERARQFNPKFADKLGQMLLAAIHGDERDMLTWYDRQNNLSSQLNNPAFSRDDFLDKHGMRSDISHQLNNPEAY